MASVALFQYALVLDLIVLGLIGTPTDLGLYSAPAWLVVAAYVLVQVPLQAAYPELVRRYHESRERLVQLVTTLVSLAARVTLAGAAFITVESAAVVDLLFGPRYAGSAPLLSILIFVVPLGWYAGLVGYILTVAGNFRRFLASLIPPAVAATIAMPILITELGTTGAAIGAAATMGLQAFSFTLTTRRYLGLAPVIAALKELPYGLVPLAALIGLGALVPGPALYVSIPVWLAALALVEAVRGFPTFHTSGVIGLLRARGAVTSAAEGP
jgi:O-antigen/teichoic acid export membrane protein